MHTRKRPESSNSRVLSEGTIWIWGIILVGVALLSAGGMLYFFGNDPRGSSRLESIRIASTVVVGTGGAAALLLTARRQRFTELDGTERRITELQAKAAEQLGHEKAAVRLAGLYSLERLGQDHPGYRQTMTDIIAAYLRMPYSPPETSQLIGIPRERRHTRKPAWMRPNRPEAPYTPDDRRQEQQVRLAAQRILERHLAPGGEYRPNAEFWDDIDLDLAGATLENFSLRNCRLRRANFDRARFFGDFASFAGMQISGAALFRNAEFKCKYAWFKGFECASYGPRFTGAQLSEFSDFESCKFKEADFARATLGRTVSFFRAKFDGTALFESVEFHAGKDVSFQGAVFSGFASFNRAIFESVPDFDSASFNRGAHVTESEVFVPYGETVNSHVTKFIENPYFDMPIPLSLKLSENREARSGNWYTVDHHFPVPRFAEGAVE